MLCVIVFIHRSKAIPLRRPRRILVSLAVREQTEPFLSLDKHLSSSVSTTRRELLQVIVLLVIALLVLRRTSVLTRTHPSVICRKNKKEQETRTHSSVICSARRTDQHFAMDD